MTTDNSETSAGPARLSPSEWLDAFTDFGKIRTFPEPPFLRTQGSDPPTLRLKRVAANSVLGDLDGNEGRHGAEPNYGDNLGEDACWRCGGQVTKSSRSGLCDGCRAYLAEDTDVDPAHRLP